METQSHDTAHKTRLEAARQAALGTLSRARETLQVAATTVPVWARDVETRAGVQVDALLRRVGLVRIARVEAQASVAVEAPAPVSPAVEAEAAMPVVEGVEAGAETSAETAVESAEAPVATEHAGAPAARRRRR